MCMKCKGNCSKPVICKNGNQKIILTVYLSTYWSSYTHMATYTYIHMYVDIHKCTNTHTHIHI